MLGSNEAIAGLDSPAMAMTLPRNPLGAGGGGTASTGGGGNGAFNWLQSKMNDLQIGGEKKAAERGAINRNATVFQVRSLLNGHISDFFQPRSGMVLGLAMS